MKNNKSLLIIILSVAAVLLIGAGVWIYVQNRQMADFKEQVEIDRQRDELEKEYAELADQYALYEGQKPILKNDSLIEKFEAEQIKVQRLYEELKTVKKTSAARIAELRKELETLRGIMRTYIAQIDSLNTLNHQLTAEAASARREAAESRRLNEELSQQVEHLEGRVSVGAVLKARGLAMAGYTNADKVTDRSGRVARLLVTMSLIENELAQKGPVRIYVRVFDPDGKLLQDGNMTTFTFGGETLEATASREIDYQGSEVDLGIYVNNIPVFVKGIYTVQAYTEQSELGSAELLLR